jgi:spore germination cell wall hydrolase CwlJ-like protein
MINSSLKLVVATFITLGILIGYMSHVVYEREQTRKELIQIEREAALHAEQYAAQLKKHAEQIKCMALNIYHEAGSEPFMGQVAVARVVMNRVRHGFASSPCKVIYQVHYVPHPEDPDEKRKLCQFSWVCEGKENPHKHNARYLQAEAIARQVILEDRWREDIPGSVLFFHNTTVNPNWAYRHIMTIGNHIFYGRPVKKKAEVAQNS